MKEYLDLMHRVLQGKRRKDRTGVGTVGVFGEQIKIDLQKGFPLLTTKKLHTKSIVYELLWFLKGLTNNDWLKERGVTIWNEWADEHGDLGPVYGEQWVKWHGLKKDWIEDDNLGPREPIYREVVVNQIDNLIRDLKDNPFSRRHIVSAWNVSMIPQMRLPPCHTLWQCYVEEPNQGDDHIISDFDRNSLSLHLYARSIDLFLGLPFNIASYALLTHMLAAVTGLAVGRLIISFGDLHIYLNHIDQCREQLNREPRPLPRLAWGRPDITSIYDFQFEDFVFCGYDPHPAIKAQVAV